MIGKGPERVQVKIIDNVILIHVTGYMTSYEHVLLQTDNGKDILYTSRRAIYEHQKDNIYRFLNKILGNVVQETFADWIFEQNTLCFTVWFEKELDPTLEIDIQEEDLYILWN